MQTKTMINILTGKRPTLKETKEFKEKGIYKKIVLDENAYDKFSKMPFIKQKETIDRIIGNNKQKTDNRRNNRHNNRNNYRNKAHSNNKQKLVHQERYVKELKHQVISDNNLKNKNGEVLFEVVGIHSKGDGVLEPYLNEYHFKVTDKTAMKEFVQVGALAKVRTKFGFKRVLITQVIKPRSEKRIEEVKNLSYVYEIYNYTWINMIKMLERKGIIKENATFL